MPSVASPYTAHTVQHLDGLSQCPRMRRNAWAQWLLQGSQARLPTHSSTLTHLSGVKSEEDGVGIVLAASWYQFS